VLLLPKNAQLASSNFVTSLFLARLVELVAYFYLTRLFFIVALFSFSFFVFALLSLLPSTNWLA
jgi:hypothetical protein